MPGFIFGTNPDQLAQQRNVADQMNISLAQDQQRQAQDQINRQQAAQFEAARQRQAEQDSSFQFAANQAAQTKADQENEFRFGLQRQDQAAATAEDTRRFNAQLELQKSQIAGTKGQTDYAEAINAIENGDVTTPADLAKSFSNLTPQQKQRAGMYLGGKNRRESQDYQSVVDAANAATGVVRPPDVTTTAKPHWWSSPVTTTTPAAKLTEDQAMAKLSGVKALQKFLPALTWDEDKQQFVPAVPKPDGWQPTVAGAAAGQFSFGAGGPTPAPTPPTVTAGPTPVTGTLPALAVNTIYKGYRYIGGDPATSSSWVPVNQ